MTLMSPLVTGVHHHNGLRRHGGGAPPTGVVVRVVARHVLHGGRQGCRATWLQGPGWCLFYYRHNFVSFLDWPLNFSTDCREPRDASF
jgi:hypothetical protein